MRLLTIPMSHYCEKARWGLAHAGLDYVEEAHLQVFHYGAVRRHSKAGKVPVLLADGQAIADSTAILQYLDRHHLPAARKLYPEAQRAEVEALEERFDEQLGVETRRWVYHRFTALPQREVLRTAGQNTPAWERAAAPLLFPMMRRFIDARLGISAAAVAAGSAVITSTFDEVAAMLADGRPYLLGERFTAADLAFACMAAPVLLPPEYGIRLPTPQQAPPAAQPEVRAWREHPAGQFTLRLFREHRWPAGTTQRTPR
jgi:glutathione S-transferase